jgi:hypothetical protein
MVNTVSRAEKSSGHAGSSRTGLPNELGSGDAPPAEPKPRLVVELNRTAAARLDALVELEELNKTSVVNRALNVYYMLRMAEKNGGEVTITESESAPARRVLFV